MNDHGVAITPLERTPTTPVDGAAQSVQLAASPWRRVHQKLRGRYLWALLLAAIGLGCGAFFGWGAAQPLYAARGLIYIQPSMLSPKDPTGTNVLPMFQGFVAYQVDILKSLRATDMAMSTDAWKRSGHGELHMDVASFEERRSIVHTPGTQHILVQFLAPSPTIALAGVQALLGAYESLSADLNDTNASLEYARDQIDVLNGKIRVATEQILTFTAEYGGVEGMEIRHRAAVNQVLETEELLVQIQRTIRDYTESSDTSPDAHPIPPVEIAVENRQMADALSELELLEAEAEYLAEKAGEKSESLAQLRRGIDVRKRGIDQLAQAWNRVRASKQAGGATLEELRAREERLSAHLQTLAEKNRKIGETRIAVDRLQATNDDLARQRSEMGALKDQLTAQLMGKGRIKISDPGTLPTSYSRDRRLSYAVAGGFLGALLGVLVVLLISLRDRRLKDSGGIDHTLSRVRLLGLMPAIPVDSDDEAAEHEAAHCVHQIRTFLQIGHARQGGVAICVSGPGVASGKTTLTTALGLSFGSSGTRTLLVDADLTGRGLTWRITRRLLHRARRFASGEAESNGRSPTSTGAAVGAHGLVSQSLLRPADADWPEAGELSSLLMQTIERIGLQEAKSSGAIDEIFALADLIFSAEVRDELASQLIRAHGAESARVFGAKSQWIPARVLELEAQRPDVNGSLLERYLYPTGLDTLKFLPLRGLGRGGEVSVATISKILARIRADFDVALVDTGPVPGTVETSMVAVQANSVVLVVSPDDHRPDAERAVAHMEEIGANIAGIVFNRAGPRDLIRSNASRSSPRRGGPSI